MKSVSQPLFSAIKETKKITLSIQERELHSEAVLSAPSRKGSKIKVLPNNGGTGEASDPIGARKSVHPETASEKIFAEKEKKEDCQDRNFYVFDRWKNMWLHGDEGVECLLQTFYRNFAKTTT